MIPTQHCRRRREEADLIRTPQFGEHARPGRGGTRPAFRIWFNVLPIRYRYYFVRPPVFREARKTAPGAGARSFLFRSLGLTNLAPSSSSRRRLHGS